LPYPGPFLIHETGAGHGGTIKRMMTKNNETTNLSIVAEELKFKGLIFDNYDFGG
jgi:hypothetical protein